MRSATPRLIAALAAAEIFIVALVAPALLFPSFIRLSLLGLVALAWYANYRVSGRVVPTTPLNGALYLLLVMVAVSLVVTYDVQLSLGKVAGVVLGVLVFWAVVRWVDAPMRLGLMTAAFLLAGAGLAVIGLLGTNWIDKFTALAPIVARLPRAIRGVPGAEEGFQPNAVAGCLILFVPLQVALLAGPRDWPTVLGLTTRSSWTTAFQLLLLALTLGTLVLTQSRGAWLGLMAGTLAFLAWHGRRTRLAAAAILVAAAVVVVALGPARVADLAIVQSGRGMANNVAGRTELWSRALYGIEDFPLTGMGMNVFRHVAPVWYPMYLTPPDEDFAHAHNHLLQVALDLGIPGLAAYLWMWIATGAVLVRTYRHSSHRVYRTMAGGLGVGLIAHFMFGMTDAIPLGAKVGVLFWLTLGLTVGLYRIAARSAAA
jgi:putative inorganic carbon (hco3(-)) transporter